MEKSSHQYYCEQELGVCSYCEQELTVDQAYIVDSETYIIVHKRLHS